MNLLHIILYLLGGSACLLFILLLCWGVTLMCDAIMQKYYERGMQAQWEKDQQRLRDMAYWFSEDKPTQNLIESLSKLQDTGHIRYLWRKDRAKSDPTLAGSAGGTEREVV